MKHADVSSHRANIDNKYFRKTILVPGEEKIEGRKPGVWEVTQ